MNKILYVILGLTVGLLQISLVNALSFFDTILQLQIVVLILLQFTKKGNKIYYFAVATGFIADIFSASIFGQNMLVFASMAFIFDIAFKRFIQKENRFVLFLSAFIATLLYATLMIVISGVVEIINPGNVQFDLSVTNIRRAVTMGVVNSIIFVFGMRIEKRLSEYLIERAFK